MSEMQADEMAGLRASGDLLDAHGLGWTRFSRWDDGTPLWVRWQDIVMVSRGDDGTTIAVRGCPQLVAIRESVKDVLSVVRHPRNG